MKCSMRVCISGARRERWMAPSTCTARGTPILNGSGWAMSGAPETKRPSNSVLALGWAPTLVSTAKMSLWCVSARRSPPPPLALRDPQRQLLHPPFVSVTAEVMVPRSLQGHLTTRTITTSDKTSRRQYLSKVLKSHIVCWSFTGVSVTMLLRYLSNRRWYDDLNYQYRGFQDPFN